MSNCNVNSTDFGLSNESIVCFAGEDWWYHHPHSKNHILKRLAAQNKVLFVNSITMGLPSASNPDFLLKIRRKLRSYMRWLRKVPEGLYVLTPISVPFYSSRIGRLINRLLLLFQLRLIMLVLGMRKPTVVWAAIPTAADLVDSLGAKLILYQVSDKYEANEDSALSSKIIREMDQHLKQQAAVVMYSGRKLFEESDVPHRYFLEQAVDFDRFAGESSDVATEVARIPRPILGYFGAMDYVMDVPLMEEVARRRPQWHWLMIGRKSNLVQFRAPNIHCLPPCPYEDLPRYIGPVDVFVLPWSQSNTFTSYGSAIKVREYLATGKPVVISPLYEYLKTPGVRVYRTTEEFIAAVESALRDDTPADRAMRQSAVRNCTWDIRAAEVGKLIANCLKGRFSGGKLVAGPSQRVIAEQKADTLSV